VIELVSYVLSIIVSLATIGSAIAFYVTRRRR